MLNQIRRDHHAYKDGALGKKKVILLKLTQKVMREMTEFD